MPESDEEMLKKLVATSANPQVKQKAAELLATLQRARGDGKRSPGGIGDRVILKVQRAGDGD